MKFWRKKVDKDSNLKLDIRGLEESALEAEKNGDLKTALRLRYRVGLLKLESSGVLSKTELSPRFKLSRQMHLHDFDEVSVDLEDVVYGDFHTTNAHLERSREKWPEILIKAKSK
ncbi:MAG: hypothetical protein HKL80_03600 [Acidimicrobiales bacterium]|nr:hypothetical protein [Acidimicrobiales bacterium]